MPGLLEGKTCLVLGIANKWSLAYAIAQAFSREGARLALTYLGEHQKEAIETLADGLAVDRILPCDVTRDEDMAGGWGGRARERRQAVGCKLPLPPPRRLPAPLCLAPRP